MPYNKNITPDIVTHKKILGCTEVVSVCQYHCKEPTMHLYPYSITTSSCCQGVHPLSFWGPYRWHGVVPGDAEQRQCTRTRQCSHLVAVTPKSCAITPIPYHACTGALAEKLNVWPQLPNRILVHPWFLLGGISLQSPDCLQNKGECSKQSTSGSIRSTSIIYSLVWQEFH